MKNLLVFLAVVFISSYAAAEEIKDCRLISEGNEGMKLDE